MNEFEKLLALTLSRRRKNSFVNGLMKALLWGCLCSLLLGALNFVYPVPYLFFLFTLIPFTAVTTVFFILYRRRKSLADEARCIDGVLKAGDRFATAYECLGKKTLNPVEQELLKRINSECGRIKPVSVAPIGFPRETPAVLLVFVVFTIVFSAMLYGRLFAFFTPVVQRTLLAGPVNKLEKKLKLLERSEDPRKRKVAKKLQDLLKQLKGARSFEEMLGKARRLLEQLRRSETDPEAKKSIEMLGRVAKFLSKSKMTRQVAEAFRQGDLRKAADLTRTLAERIKNSTGMSRKDIQRLAKNLKMSANACDNPSSSFCGKHGQQGGKSGQQGGKSGQQGGKSGQQGGKSGQQGGKSGQQGGKSGQQGGKSGQQGGRGGQQGGKSSHRDVLNHMGRAGDALRNGDIDTARKELVKASQRMEELARRGEANHELDKAGRSLEKSIQQITKGSGKSMFAQGSRAGKNRRGKARDINNDRRTGKGKGQKTAGRDTKNTVPRKAGRDASSTTSGLDATKSNKSVKGRSSANITGKLQMDAVPKLDRDARVVERGLPSRGYTPPGRGGRSGRRKDIPPFRARNGSDKTAAVRRYEEKVNDYLAREKVPREYREIIKNYFGLPEGEER